MLGWYVIIINTIMLSSGGVTVVLGFSVNPLLVILGILCICGFVVNTFFILPILSKSGILDMDDKDALQNFSTVSRN